MSFIVEAVLETSTVLFSAQDYCTERLYKSV
jgi:hypothetical protein